MANYYLSRTSQAGYSKYIAHPRLKKHQPSRRGLGRLRNMCNQSHLFFVFTILSLYSHSSHIHSHKAADGSSCVLGATKYTLYSCTLNVCQQVGTGSSRFYIQQRNPSPVRTCETRLASLAGVRKNLEKYKKITKRKKIPKKTAVRLD